MLQLDGERANTGWAMKVDGTESSTEGSALDPSRVCFLAMGEGPEVVLVHGLGQDHRAWGTLQRELARGFRTYAYDLRGHGGTPVGEASGTLAQLGSDLVVFLDWLGARPRALVGYSLGGTVVLWVAARRPDLVSKVVAIATSSVVGERAVAGYQREIEILTGRDREAIREMISEHIAMTAHKPVSGLQEVVNYELECIGDGEGFRNAATAMIRLRQEPLTPELGRIQVPVLLIGGAHDRFCPPKAQHIMLEALPNGRYVELADAGHRVLEEAGGAVLAAVRSFLEESSG
ncbi:MAG: alpha/beta fold hydrolase [Armatimonadota bacterium]|nr:alpha/beta fold hydrolase [Armatimonadota bacterium]